MNDDTIIKTVNRLLFAASVLLIYGISYIEPTKKETETRQTFTPKDFGSAPRSEWYKEQPWHAGIIPDAITKEAELRNVWQDLPVSYETIETTYLGRYFITAYCPAECGYNGSNYPTGWTTSSGAICHYSSDPLIPTTCAIDRNFHKYGEHLMIDGKIYVTEDTGPGVRGLWVDCFVETMPEVENFNTRYTAVYAVSYQQNTISKNERKKIHEWLNNYLHRSSPGDRLYFRDRNGVIYRRGTN
jgi:3D (Asp-Asp-Asp) domain-containing protein